MNNKIKFAISVVAAAAFVTLGWLVLRGHSFAVLNPQGIIAHKQFGLLVTAFLLMLIVVIPVFILTFYIAWKYRATNTKAHYMPDWDHHHGLEFIWWAIPCALILALSILTWKSSHELDPYRALDSNVKPITIQVVALQWKWLFIYPDQHIASVNLVEFPEKTPVNFEITADAPMNSFWIPQLGGQIYAMAGMNTSLHLMADTTGLYDGSSVNISGKGFSGMTFKAKSTSAADFDAWVKQTRASGHDLSAAEYDKLAKPSENSPVASYALSAPDLYNDIMMKYMMPTTDLTGVAETDGR
jgi:cytochrome o ubiquinol oxidase subunit 2